MSDPARLVGVVLAAGRGARMGRTKQLLPWPPGAADRTVVEAAFDAIAPACGVMVVVSGHEAARVEAALAPREFRIVRCPPEQEMIESIRAGIRAARAADAVAGIVLQPGDHPELAPATLVRLREAWASAPEQAHLPEHEGRGGHPVVIPAAIARRILTWTGDGGLRAFWEANPDLCTRVEVDDPGVVRDLDTPEDYAAR